MKFQKACCTTPFKYGREVLGPSWDPPVWLDNMMKRLWIALLFFGIGENTT